MLLSSAPGVHSGSGSGGRATDDDCILDIGGVGGGPRRAASDPCVPTSPCTPPTAPVPSSPRRRRVPSSVVNTVAVNSGGSASASAVFVAVPPAPPAPKPQIVQAEFVYADGGRSVSLCGDWNSWLPQPMEKEPDGNGIWSTVVLVPTGLREFCYLVDGRYQVSRRHPTNAQGTANWRTVHGPPAATSTAADDNRLVKSTTPRLLKFADNAAIRLRAALSGTFIMSRTTLPSNNADLAPPQLHRKSKWRGNNIPGSLHALAVVFLLFATFIIYFAIRAAY